MKNIYLFLVLILFSCGGNDDNTPLELPIAVDDTATTSENNPISINVLSNDTLENKAIIDGFDTTSTNNGVIIKVSNRLFYTPASNFTGTDTFTYTICDQLSNPNCSTATVTVTVTDTGDPLAVSDTFEVNENTTTIFTTLLDNDTIVDGAILTSVDDTSTSGTIILNSDNSISYTSLNGFSGEDTFTYTLCDNDPTPNCSTATVTLTVIDEGNPLAVDDSITILRNQTTTITSVLDNDSIVDDAVISSVDDTNTQGSLVLSANGSLSYQPLTNFVGEDSFTYTICDDDTPNSCSTASVTLTIIAPINFNIPTALQDYYKDVLFVEDMSIMFDEIEDVTKTNHTTILSYGQRHTYLYNADADLSNTDNVVLVYSGESRYWEEYTSPTNSYSPQTFNTEHIYPQSLYAGGDGGADKDEIVKADLHHLRSCDDAVNTRRLNHPFVDGSGSNALIGGNSWFPGDEWKGDVARMILYLNVRYGESFNPVGSLELFLKWNVEDPVSEFEEQRNNVIYAAQGNRIHL